MKGNNLMKTRGTTKWVFACIANENVFILSLYVCMDIYIYICLHIYTNKNYPWYSGDNPPNSDFILISP